MPPQKGTTPTQQCTDDEEDIPPVNALTDCQETVTTEIPQIRGEKIMDLVNRNIPLFYGRQGPHEWATSSGRGSIFDDCNRTQ